MMMVLDKDKDDKDLRQDVSLLSNIKNLIFYSLILCDLK